MKWFEGSISEAVVTLKSKKAIFVVFVEGKDDASVEVARMIDTVEVSSVLERDDFVAIRLESGSEAYRFFVEIYQLVPVPSLFFIGADGTPLEVIVGNATAPDLVSKIDTVLAKVGKDSKASSADLIESERKVAADASSTATSVPSVDTDKVAAADPQAETVPLTEEPTKASSDSVEEKVSAIDTEKSESCTNSSSNETVAEKLEAELESSVKEELTTEEKVKRATQLIEQRRKEHVEDEQKKECEREIERRRTSRDIQKLRQKQQDLEMKQAHQEIVKEKAAIAAAREKVRLHIAQNKLERKQKELALQQQVQQQQQSQEQAKIRFSVPNDVSVARIQFRLPSGNPHMGQFEPTTTLRSLRSYVIENIDLPFRNFAMSTSFPRRDLTNEDDSKTLLDLELVPTAVILILPVKNSNVIKAVSMSPNMGFISRTIWTLLAPFIGICNYVINYFSGGPRDRADNQRDDSANTPAATSSSDGPVSPQVHTSHSPGLLRRNLGSHEGTTIMAQGNIHRLHSGRDDNDENNTWNGNSTQQM